MIIGKVNLKNYLKKAKLTISSGYYFLRLGCIFLNREHQIINIWVNIKTPCHVQ